MRREDQEFSRKNPPTFSWCRKKKWVSFDNEGHISMHNQKKEGNLADFFGNVDRT
jgi:hypothetical protein